MSNIYTRMGNIEFKGLVKVNDKTITINQLENSLLDPILWSGLITYNSNQFVSYQGNLYYSKISNNLNNLPTDTNSWQLYKDEGGNVDVFKVNSLLFKIPTITGAGTLHLYVDFSSTSDFASVTTYSSDDVVESSLFKVFSGTQMENFPSGGVTEATSGKIIDFDISLVDETLLYFRFYWYDGSDFSTKKFGRRDGTTQFFDATSTTSSTTITASSDHFSGNGTAELPLQLKTTITGVKEFSVVDDFTINASNGTKKAIINASDITFNSSSLNTAGGLVKLDGTGKIPTSLYDAGTGTGGGISEEQAIALIIALS